MHQALPAVEQSSSWFGVQPLLLWMWENIPHAIPLVVLGALAVIRFTGWHLKFVPAFEQCVSTLTTTGDLAAAFPGSTSQRRLRTLLDNKEDAKVKPLMKAAEQILADWFGREIWSAKALRQALVLTVIYPFAALAAVWVFAGRAEIGPVTFLSPNLGFWRRLLGLLGIVLCALVLWRCLKWVRRRWRGWRCVIAAGTLFFLFVEICDLGLGKGSDLRLGAVIVIGLMALIGVDGAVTFAAISSAFLFGLGALLVSGPFGIPIDAWNPSGGEAALLVGSYFLASCGATFLFVRGRQSLQERIGGRNGFTISALTWVVLLLLVVSVSPYWARTVATHNPAKLPVGKDFSILDSFEFSFIFFGAWLPVLNAILDVVSVGLTRTFLRRYLVRGGGWWWLVPLDILATLVLTVVLYASVIASLELFEALGWGVDAGAIARQFAADSASPRVQWILWTATTNVLPTLLHLALVAGGLWSGWLLRDSGFLVMLERLREADGPARSGRIILPEAPRGHSSALRLSQPLSRPQAVKLVNSVYVDFWLGFLLPPALLLACWPLWRRLMQLSMTFVS